MRLGVTRKSDLAVNLASVSVAVSWPIAPVKNPGRVRFTCRGCVRAQLLRDPAGVSVAEASVAEVMATEVAGGQ